MNQTDNKVNLKEILSGLKSTASDLSLFLNQTKEDLSQEHKDLLDNEFKKAQQGLSKIMTDINNFKA